MKVVKIPVFWEYNWNGLLKSAMVKKQIQWGKLWIMNNNMHCTCSNGSKRLGEWGPINYVKNMHTVICIIVIYPHVVTSNNVQYVQERHT